MMDNDLRDLISAWLGSELDSSRAAELLRRVREDAEFRREFVEQSQILSAIKAAQSPEPRWLSLEDEIGLHRSPESEESFEERILRSIKGPRRHRHTVWALTAIAFVAAIAISLWPSSTPPHTITEQPATTKLSLGTIAVLVNAAEVRWGTLNHPSPTVGTSLGVGPISLLSGQVTLQFVNGVILSVVGPAELDLWSADRVFCRSGKIRTRVPLGAEGFTVFAPGSAVVDLGTEFAMNVANDGTAEVMVFEGKAEVSVLNAAGHTLSSEPCLSHNALAIDPAAGRIRNAVAEPARFAPPPTWTVPPLVLKPEFAASVRLQQPWGYWRFREHPDEVVPNEVADGPAFRAINGVHLISQGEAGAAKFGPGRQDQMLVLDGIWPLQRDAGYAIELWVLSEQFQHSSLVSIRPDGIHTNHHAALLELTGRSRALLHEECTFRFLDRWPPGRSGGANVFTSTMYTPNRWHHLVAQVSPSSLELYVDGVLAGSTPTVLGTGDVPCRVILGRMKPGKDSDSSQIRPLVGCLAELAIYNHLLTPEVIRQHASLYDSNADFRVEK